MTCNEWRKHPLPVNPGKGDRFLDLSTWTWWHFNGEAWEITPSDGAWE